MIGASATYLWILLAILLFNTDYVFSAKTRSLLGRGTSQEPGIDEDATKLAGNIMWRHLQTEARLRQEEIEEDESDSEEMSAEYQLLLGERTYSQKKCCNCCCKCCRRESCHQCINCCETCIGFLKECIECCCICIGLIAVGCVLFVFIFSIMIIVASLLRK